MSRAAAGSPSPARAFAVDADVIRYANGLIFRRAVHVSGAVPVWEFDRGAIRFNTPHVSSFVV